MLPADLVCAPPNAIYLDSNARLELNGHALDGCDVQATGFETDTRKLFVHGPGEIRNAGVRLHRGLLRISDVVIVDATGDGIRGGTASKVRADGVTVTGSEGSGITATKVDARDVTSTDNGVTGIRGSGGVNGRNLLVSGNLEGISSAAGKITLRYSEVTGNDYVGVRTTTCATSLNSNGSGSWGVCSSD